MKKLSAHEIALSALSCALSTMLLTLGANLEVLLFTGYLFGSIALMLPLAKKSYVGFTLAYIATCLLSLLFVGGRIWDLLPFIMFFGLHPLVNELQLKIRINRWLACAIKAVWFDVTMFIIWKFVFGGLTPIPYVDEYIIPILLVLGTAFFVFYDYTSFKCRIAVNQLVARLNKK